MSFLVAAVSILVAAAAPSAPVCAAAQPAVAAFDRLVKNPATRVENALDAANAAAAGMDACASTMRDARNPAGAQYAAVRGAQFRLVAGRLLRATGHASEARTTLVAAIDGADTVDEHSVYREAAVAIRDAARAELAKMGPAPGP